MRLGQRFESARRPSVLFAPALRHRRRKASNTTFAEGSEREHDDLSSMRTYRQPVSLENRALLTEGDAKNLALEWT